MVKIDMPGNQGSQTSNAGISLNTGSQLAESATGIGKVVEQLGSGTVGLGNETRQLGQQVMQTGDKVVGYGKDVVQTGMESVHLGGQQIALGQSYIKEATNTFGKLAEAQISMDFNKSFNDAKMQYENYKQQRFQHLTDENGNSNYDSIPTDLLKAGQDIYNQAADKITNPVVKQRLQESLNSYVTNDTIGSLDKVRGIQTQNLRVDLQNNLDDISKTALGSDSINFNLIRGQAQSAIGDALVNGVISPSEANKLSSNFVNDLYTTRIKDLVKTNPQQALQELQDYKKYDVSDLEANIYKKQSEHNLRSMSQLLIDGSIVSKNEVTKIFSNANKLLANGTNINDGLMNDLITIGKQNPTLANAVQQISTKQDLTSKFSSLTSQERSAYIHQLESDPNLKANNVNTITYLNTLNNNLNKRIKEDPVSLAMDQGYANIQPIDFDKPLAQQLEDRQTVAAMVSQKYNTKSSGLTNTEITTLKNKIDNGTTDDKLNILKDIIVGLKDKSIPLFTAISKKGGRELAIAGSFMESGDIETAKSIFQGQDILKNKQVDMFSPDDQRTIIQEVLPNKFAIPQQQADIVKIADDIYAKQAFDQGILNTKDNGVMNEKAKDLYKSALMQAANGTPIEVDYKATDTYGIFNGRTAKILPPEKGMTADQFNSWKNSVTVDDINKLGGMKGVDNPTDFLQNQAMLVSAGNGKYAVFKEQDRQFVPIYSNQTDDNGKPLPFILDYNAIKNQEFQEPKAPIDQSKIHSLNSEFTTSSYQHDQLATNPKFQELDNIIQNSNLDKTQIMKTADNITANTSTLDIAKQYLGQNENDNTKTLSSFFQKTLGQNIDPTQVPWCAAFVNAIEKSAGRPGTDSLAARSFLNYGTPTDTPTKGDIVVFSRGNDNTKGHVGFFVGINGDKVIVLGGNQGNAVSIKEYDKNTVLGYRTPPKAEEMQQILSSNKTTDLQITNNGQDMNNQIGSISSKYEGGKSATISDGNGDPGGKSYGEFQLSSKTGTLSSFLTNTGYDSEFKGMTIGSNEFDTKWKELSKDPQFAQAQHDYIQTTLYQPVREYANKLGIMDNPAINEALFSISVQHGGADKIVQQAMQKADPKDPVSIVKNLYLARSNYVKNLPNVPQSTKNSILKRYQNEVKDVLAML